MDFLKTVSTTTNEKNDYERLNNNRVCLHGHVVSAPEFSHEVFGEGFYELMLSVDRLSNMKDVIPVTISRRLLEENNVIIGMTLTVKGQFRSYNKIVGERSKLMLTVFAREVVCGEDSTQTNKQVMPSIPFLVDNNFAPETAQNPNIIELTGYICKAPIYRTTPFNREICDLLIAVNRAYNKSDYIPAIAWGRNARFAKTMTVGEKVHISGRVQSREYQKRISDDQVETRIAYEISVNKISRENLDSQFDPNDSAFFEEIEMLI